MGETPEALFLQASLKEQQGDLAGAEAVLVKMLAAVPAAGSEGIEVLDRYVQLLQQQGKVVEVFQAYKNALRRQPKNGTLIKKLARAYMAQRLFDQAAVCWKRVLELNPDDKNAHIDYGFVRSCTGSERRKQVLAQLDQNHIYRDVAEAKALAIELVDTFPMSDEQSRGIASEIMAELQLNQAYAHVWWEERLARFSNGADDKVLRGVTSMVLSWSIPTDEALARIAAFAGEQRLFSYGAGGAYWEYLLHKQFDQSVVATDIMLGNRFMPTEKLDIHTAQVQAGDAVFIGWVRTVESIGQAVIRLLSAMQSGQRLIMVGDQPAEGVPRTCGTPALFAFLNAHFFLQETIPLPHFKYLHDAVCLWVRR